MLISPLPQSEPEDVRIGRWEVWQCWSDGVLGLEADGMALAAKGAVQITFDGDEGIRMCSPSLLVSVVPLLTQLPVLTTALSLI
jgi:hypothetical protein